MDCVKIKHGYSDILVFSNLTSNDVGTLSNLLKKADIVREEYISGDRTKSGYSEMVPVKTGNKFEVSLISSATIYPDMDDLLKDYPKVVPDDELETDSE